MFEHILIPLDGSSLAECVLPHAAALGRTFDSQVKLLRVLQPRTHAQQTPTVEPMTWEIRKAEFRAYLKDVSARLRRADIQTREIILEGSPADRIIQCAQDEDVDLIIISSHGQSGLSKWNINSVVQKVILQAYTPMLIVRAYEPTESGLTSLNYRRILLPLDGSQRAECVLPLATTLAQAHEAQLLVAHVVNRPEVPRRASLTEEESALVDRLTELNRENARQYLEGLRPRLSADVQTRVRIDPNPATSLHGLVAEDEIDLVILSAHGYSGQAQWPYGSVALNFIAFGTTPLMIVQDIPRQEAVRTRAERFVQEEAGH